MTDLENVKYSSTLESTSVIFEFAIQYGVLRTEY
jgi:hypothetical protein